MKLRAWLSVICYILRHPIPDKPTYIRRTEERWYGNDKIGVYWEEERGQRP